MTIPNDGIKLPEHYTIPEKDAFEEGRKQQHRADINWGDEYCQLHSVNDLVGIRRRRKCDECWQPHKQLMEEIQ